MSKKKKLPNKVKESDFLAALEKVSNKLARKYRFAYHDLEDMKQQAAIFALEGLESYDNNRPLENFLWTHVRNRLFNFKRNNYQRPDKPCLKCPLHDPHNQKSSSGCEKYNNKNDCDLYNAWSKRNETKKNIMAPKNMDNISDYNNLKQYDPSSILDNSEIIKLLDNKIYKPEYRESYLKLKNGIKINAAELNKLKIYILNILEENKNND